jgi:hypothetical protein
MEMALSDISLGGFEIVLLGGEELACESVSKFDSDSVCLWPAFLDSRLRGNDMS